MVKTTWGSAAQPAHLRTPESVSSDTLGPSPKPGRGIPRKARGLLRASRQIAGGRHMHLVLDPSCPLLHLLKWEEKGREGTGGADEGGTSVSSWRGSERNSAYY